jgi:hypothetical protein
MAAACPFRALCEGMRQVSCRAGAKDTMAEAIEACAGGECFVIFGNLARSRK